MDTKNEIELLKEEIANLSKKIDKIDKNDIPVNLLNELKELTQKIEGFKEQIPEEKIEEIKEKSKKTIDEIEDFVKTHPFISILGAVTIGYLLGKTK